MSYQSMGLKRLPHRTSDSSTPAEPASPDLKCFTAVAVVSQRSGQLDDWPCRPDPFGNVLTPVEAAQYLRLDEVSDHTPESAVRTLNYWRDRGVLRATKYARHVWYLREELDRFLKAKTAG